MEDNKKAYLIPVNADARFEVIAGYGWKELFINLVFLCAGAVMAVGLFWFVRRYLISLVPPAITGTFGFVLVFRDPRLGRSPIDLLRDRGKYASRTQQYVYVFGEGRRP